MMFVWILLSAVMLALILLVVLKFFPIRERVEAPSQDALLSPEELKKHAEEIARGHTFSKNTGLSDCLVSRMEKNFQLITNVYRMLNEDVRKKVPVPPAAEWLLDNFYIVEEQVQEIKQILIREKCLRLNILNSGFLKGFPRIYAIALELVSHLDGRLDEKITGDFIRAYQSRSILSMGELWALPVMLKIALIENIKNICEKMGRSQEQWRKVEKLSDSDLASLTDLIDEHVKQVDDGVMSFLEHLLKKLRRKGTETGEFLRYLDQKLIEFDSSVDRVIQEEHREQACRQVAMGNSVSSLRLVAAINWNEMFEELSLVEKILRSDGIYPRMDFASRDRYRHEVERIARELNTSETNVARRALELAQNTKTGPEKNRHIGYFIVGRGRQQLYGKLGREHDSRHLTRGLSAYLWPVGLLTGVIVLLGISYAWYASGRGSLLMSFLVGILILIPALDIAIAVVNRIISARVSPAFFPKLSFEEGVPEEATTLVVIPTLLPNPQRVRELVKQLEVHYLSNRENNLFFALLGDLKDADREILSTDEEIIRTALQGVKELNIRYTGEKEIFFFLSRKRQFASRENKWMGWERKRGALMELNDFLVNGKQGSFNQISGNPEALSRVKYVITLDADTRLPLHMARKLIGTIAHPLNRPVINQERGIVEDGYGLIQPRIGVSVESCNQTFFSRLFAGLGGIDPYTTAVSDVYQDYFGEGIFTGKGIYDLYVFQQILAEAIPDGTVLSHDLLEGNYVRVGLATDLELVDAFPARYNSYMMRLHRWVRGDWQIIKWLFSRVQNRSGKPVVNPLSSVSKWKIFDNLRRSLVPIAIFLLFICGLVFLPGHPLFWLALGLTAISFPLIMEILDYFVLHHYRTARQKCFGTMIYGVKGSFYQVLLLLAFLPYQAFLMMDAIFRTLYRVFVSKRKLLEWVTAADIERTLKNNFSSFLRKMAAGSILALVFFFLVQQFRPEYLVYAGPLVLVWIASPGLAYYISKSYQPPQREMDPADVEYLRKLTRKTWAYYEDFAKELDHFLPPDNFQENPPNGIAHRTSPTNIGFLLIAVLSARDLGFIGTAEMVDRLEKTLTTVEKMKKWKGHLYNWYDTTTLEILRPAYVSTVDSGNFISYLMVLKHGLLEYLHKPLLDQELLKGLKCTLNLVENVPRQITVDLADWEGREKISLIEWQRLLENLAALQLPESNWSNRFFRMVNNLRQETNDLFFRSEDLPRAPRALEDNPRYRELMEMKPAWESDCSLLKLQEWYQEWDEKISGLLVGEKNPAGKEWLIAIKEEVFQKRQQVEELVRRMGYLVEMIDKLVSGTAFLPLYDQQKRLFSIGYNVEEEKLTNSFYDLLASEARITSFLAVSRGEVPEEHWFRLGKSLTDVDGYRGLVSWAGTMFEYFMPHLIMKNYPNTLLDETYQFAARVQKKYGTQRGVPWGTSESGFFSFDIHLNYQYKAFGVPDLGLKRGLVNDMVVSPYSTLLVLPFDPDTAMENIIKLKEDGLEGEYGFYEAVDYTPERLFMGKKIGLVQSYMAHHQGMSLIALNNFFHKNIMQERFHRDPLVKAGELLLQEKVPLRVIITKENKEVVEPFQITVGEAPRVVRRYSRQDLQFPVCHLLSNSRYSVLITGSGLGYSKKEEIYLTRWRENLAVGKWGTFIFLQNLSMGETWSAGLEPLRKEPDEYRVIFAPDKAEIFRADGNIGTNTEITVSPEDNVEIRRVTITNHGDESAVLEVTSYWEVVLTTQAADVAHPGFSNLFVKTELLSRYDCLVASRRPRGDNGHTVWAIHGVKVEGETVGSFHYETDRSKFLGRGRAISDPRALDPGQPLSNTVGAVLDPIMSLRRRVKVHPGRQVQVTFFTGVVESHGQVRELAEKYAQKSSAKRAFELAWTRSEVEEGYLNLKPDEIKTYQDLISQIVFLSPVRRKYQDLHLKNRKGQPGLWKYGISGDLPIVLVAVNSVDEIELVNSVLKGHEYWRFKGLRVDLVLLNKDESSYLQPLQELLRETVLMSHARDVQERSGGVFIRNARLMPPEDLVLLYTAARVVIEGEQGPVAAQIKINGLSESLPPEKEFFGVEKKFFSKDDVIKLHYFNGYGGFSPDGKEYVLRLKDGQHTPAPWINVISNPNFGFLVTESGSGYTWAENSRENKITPWFNDPVSDPPGEILYLRDEDTGKIWSVTALPVRETESYTIRHGIGYSVFQHISHGISQELTVFVPVDDPVKINLLKLKNLDDSHRRLTVTYYIRPVLGVTDQVTQQYLTTERGEDGRSILIRNSYNSDFPERVAFVACSQSVESCTGNNLEFFGIGGDLKQPAALSQERLSGQLGAGFDPCVAVQVPVELDPGEEKELVFLLGQGNNVPEVHRLTETFASTVAGQEALLQVREFWNRKLGVFQVETPDLTMDLLINGWLVYQAVSCRIWGRSAFYQSGGAYGFRDQLQDVMGLIHVWPELARRQILLHASHQFLEGDVQHWWHPGSGDKGVRTRFSDDLLWLPHVTAEYVMGTGDQSILREEVTYLEDDPLKDGEDERYGIPRASQEKSSVYEHCIRAIERSLQFGVHGLPLMGSGDWNDGMNCVGNQGKGESVWLGWFLCDTLTKFASLCRIMNDSSKAEEYLARVAEISRNIDENAWDGGWYRRAYFDCGLPLGSAENSECRIDSITQSWAVISGAGREDRWQEAMNAAENYLVKKEEGLILLLTPPFEEGDLKPGYIKGYLPGVRENGGQYTHAAIWVIYAFVLMGDGDKAWFLFNMINPINHTRTGIECATYKVEPYVMAADVYTVNPHVGRGGWTWYTGAASWMFRVGLEFILGMKKQGDNLIINPCVPKDWPGYRVFYRDGETLYRIMVQNPDGVNRGIRKVRLDGQVLRTNRIPLVNDGKEHLVEAVMG